jgi:hypothetical protein
MPRQILSKSDLQSLLQCQRKLWLDRYKPELISKDDSSLNRRITDGYFVGEKAREQLGSDCLWPKTEEDKNSAAESARRMLTLSPEKSATEFPVIHAGLYARADALIPEGGGYVLQETKAKTFPLKSDKVTPGPPEEHHLNDVAIQAWALEGSGLPLVRVELNLLNSKWCYPGEEDYSGLFRQLDVTAEIHDRKAHVGDWINQAEGVLAGDMPQIVTGKQCSDPHPCPFMKHCESIDPPRQAHPIELLPGLAGKNLARKLRETKGYTSILEPEPEELAGKQAPLYRRIQTAHREERGVLETGTVEMIAHLPFPRYYFDFEAIDLPVPRWKGLRPYEHVPFQWSCHIERSPARFEHAEFLDLTGNDPSLACIERMRQAIDPSDGGPIIVYYAAYERTRLKEFGIRHPEHNELVQTYVNRLFDLHPIIENHFYHPKMAGSFSIKKVLPVVAPDLDYSDLDEVQEGTAAQVAYLYAALDPHTPAIRKADLEEKLRTYCRQDTWAMVEVAYFLAQSVRPVRPAGM